MGPRGTKIQELLQATLAPSHLSIVDESNQHSRGIETHFKAIIVSSRFSGLSRVKRQQIVYQVLLPLFSEGLHALSLTTATPEEWQNNAINVNDSPTCQHRS